MLDEVLRYTLYGGVRCKSDYCDVTISTELLTTLTVSFKRSLIYLLPQVVFIIDIIFIIYTFIILR